jgi:hypothetical protein
MMDDGKWRMKSGEWRVESGEMRNAKLKGLVDLVGSARQMEFAGIGCCYRKKNAHLKTRWAQNQSADIGLELEIVAGTSNDHGFIKINFGVGNRIAN